MQTKLLTAFTAVRQQTERLTESLSAEDMLAQSMPDASPAKWHLAHTSWFFETFILLPFLPDYRLFHPFFPVLFNSYYESVGDRHPRPQRGLLTRPSLKEVRDYRAYVDQHMQMLLNAGEADYEKLAFLLEVGLHHEMQHQELLLTDILHLFSTNPMLPAVFPEEVSAPTAPASEPAMSRFEGGLFELGASAEGFSYDNERPRHTVYLTPFALSNTLVTNGEWLEFMQDGGYRNSLLWLSDGWATCNREQWFAPLYWQEREDEWMQFALTGLHSIDKNAPVSHISYYEADAFARWAGKRLPREAEWEFSASQSPIDGNFLERGVLRPLATGGAGALLQLYGDVWEWTQSSYAAYPGFNAELGALGEYNGKFMANQFVLRGGSCVTPVKQMRSSYRNFFYPHQRWQFSGLRLAEDL